MMAVKVLIIGWGCASFFDVVSLAASIAGNLPLCVASSFVGSVLALVTPLFASN